jgi:hypothetical protein
MEKSIYDLMHTQLYYGSLWIKSQIAHQVLVEVSYTEIQLTLSNRLWDTWGKELLSRWGQKRIWVFIQSANYCCPSLTKFGIFMQMLVKVPNAKFHENPSSVVLEFLHADRQT